MSVLDRQKPIAVVYADMIGYSRLIGLDDAGTLQRLRMLRNEVIDLLSTSMAAGSCRPAEILCRTEEARAALQKALELSPPGFEFYTSRRPPWHRPEDYEHMLDGLRKAGWQG